LISVAAHPTDKYPVESQCPLIVTHTLGAFEVPAETNVRTDELAQFLRKRLPPRLVSLPDPDIAEYLQRQLSQFNPDQVFWCQASLSAPLNMRRSTRRAWIACFVAGVAILIVGAALSSVAPGRGGVRARDDRATQWFAVGTTGLLVGAFGWMLHAAMCRNANPKVKDAALSSLVISPAGIALRQGDLKGELRWAEIRGVQFNRKPPVKLQLAGVTVPILNIYERPLVEIHKHIRQYVS
jgi:hypothetical protein